MSTAPKFVTLDRRSLGRLDDLVPARVTLLRQVVTHQHTLMSGWGGPPQARSLYIPAVTGGTASQVVSYRVPPGVTHADVSVLMQGRGTVTLTTSADATGTKLRCVSFFDNFDSENAQWYSTEGVMDSTEGAESGRALQLVSAESWAHQNVDVTVALDASGVDNLQTWALVFRPVHVPR